MSIDNDRRCCLILNLLIDELGLDEELNDLVLENQQNLKSVEETRENLFSEMERITRCQRSQFVSSAFSQNHITKQKISNLLMDCFNFLRSEESSVFQLVSIISKMRKDNMKLIAAVDSVKSKALEAQDSVISVGLLSQQALL